MTGDILISYVVTVFNKEAYIGHTVDSLLSQEGNFASEYIFIDDVSSDRSLAILEERTRNIPNVVIIKNTINAGPSVRLNQGARLARGKYLQFIDSDDILAINASKLMLTLLERYGADVIHGGWKKTGMNSAELTGARVDDNAKFKISDSAMDFVLSHRTRRMSQMVRRDVFLKAGGADEGVFVQDESLTLRLARIAKRFILLDAPILLIPKVEGELSQNVAQLNHDRYLVCRRMLHEFNDLNPRTVTALYRRMISAYWKQHRAIEGKMRGLFTPAFSLYVRSRMKAPKMDERELEAMDRFFQSLDGVRRVKT